MANVFVSPFYQDAYVCDVQSTRSSQLIFIRQDTLSTNSVPQNIDPSNVGALYTLLKTFTLQPASTAFPTTAKIEGWWRAAGEDGLFVQVNDSSFNTVALNDIMPLNVF